MSVSISVSSPSKTTSFVVVSFNRSWKTENQTRIGKEAITTMDHMRKSD